jgi:hypothetical protein
MGLWSDAKLGFYGNYHPGLFDSLDSYPGDEL